mmetsp:Transcript_8493/g.13011  ORF Transcript_8493/g.13011 Transcript_8493/m.13011 type:complete len:174 (+) Transcript_8493:4943-5464(+)
MEREGAGKEESEVSALQLSPVSKSKKLPADSTTEGFLSAADWSRQDFFESQRQKFTKIRSDVGLVPKPKKKGKIRRGKTMQPRADDGLKESARREREPSIEKIQKEPSNCSIDFSCFASNKQKKKKKKPTTLKKMKSTVEVTKPITPFADESKPVKISRLKRLSSVDYKKRMN